MNDLKERIFRDTVIGIIEKELKTRITTKVGNIIKKPKGYRNFDKKLRATLDNINTINKNFKVQTSDKDMIYYVINYEGINYTIIVPLSYKTEIHFGYQI